MPQARMSTCEEEYRFKSLLFKHTHTHTSTIFNLVIKQATLSPRVRWYSSTPIMDINLGRLHNPADICVARGMAQ